MYEWWKEESWDYGGIEQNSVGRSISIRVNGGVSRDFGKGGERGEECALLGQDW